LILSWKEKRVTKKIRVAAAFTGGVIQKTGGMAHAINRVRTTWTHGNLRSDAMNIEKTLIFQNYEQGNKHSTWREEK